MYLGQSKNASTSDATAGPREGVSQRSKGRESQSTLFTVRTISQLVCRASSPGGEQDMGEMRIGCFPEDIYAVCGTGALPGVMVIVILTLL